MTDVGTLLFRFDASGGSTARRFRQPTHSLAARRIDEVPEVLAAAEEAAAGGCFAAGYVAYEAGAAFEPTLPRRSIPMPYAWFGVFEDVDVSSPELSAAGSAGGDIDIRNIRFSIPRSRYRKRIEDIRGFVREGDVYQINYTGQLRFDFSGSPEALFARLISRQPVPYAAYLEIGDFQILSCSPELFFRRRGGRIVTRPMKGTAGRGRTTQEDDEAQRLLGADEKNRAENLMIVDLLRNDLSRCCTPGSVRVPELFRTERFETLIQMSSEVEGELRPGVTLVDIFRALFPCGSVTGAPKIRAMQRIDELEDEPRGVYCGAVGWIDPQGDAEFNVAIRTAQIHRNLGRLGIGSGVVWDSDADLEYEETLMKARFFTGNSVLESDTFQLIETMRAEDGTIPLLELHLNRLEHSAEYFRIPIAIDDVRRIIARNIERPGSVRVRFTLDEDGRMRVESREIAQTPDRWRCAVASVRIDPSDPLRRFKTSHRALYTEKYREAAASGLDEVLFLNDRGELAEGSRTNVFLRSGRAWLTPPVESGALPGVYRRHILESMPAAAEQTLYIRDLIEADAVFVCNAVRGLVPAEIVLLDSPSEGIIPSEALSA